MNEETKINSLSQQSPVEGGRKDRATYLRTALLAIAALLFFVLGVVWLGLVLLVVLSAFLTYSWGKRHFGSSRWFKPIRYFMVFVSIFVVAIFFRLFVFEVFEIPSGSMEETLLPGDKILVNKLVIGPQTPKSPFDIPWVNLLFYMNKQARAHIDSVWWKPTRLSGWSGIKHNDVLVFKNEPLAPDYFIKRCVALPGDDLQIINSNIVVNGKGVLTNTLSNIKKNWVVYINDIDRFKHMADSLQINTYFNRHTEKGAGKELPLNNEHATILGHSTCIDSMHISVQQPNVDAWLRPYGKRTVWSIDNYGPIKVPYKGWQIGLNDETMTLYYETIRDWETKIENIDGQFYIDNEKVTHYTFENNYYVMMGDNRHNSIDSRMWGFLPGQKIVGKATNILWSNNHSEMKWNRILKRIN